MRYFEDCVDECGNDIETSPEDRYITSSDYLVDKQLEDEALRGGKDE